MPGPGSVACPKPRREDRLKGERKTERQQRAHVSDIRTYVFARERDLCRICRWREAESMHELRPKSLGGKVSRRNSVAVCGNGVAGCHGFAQRNEIAWSQTEWGAEQTLWFQAMTDAAAEWLKIPRLDTIESPVMVSIEAEL